MNKILSYVREAAARSREYHIFNSIPVVIKDEPESPQVDIQEFINIIEERIPRHLLENIEIVYIGDFPMLAGRNAAYADGAVYITKDEPTTYDMLENAIHEIAHSAEERYGPEIYADDRLKSEFLAKRQKLYEILTSHEYHINPRLYSLTEYNKEFDDFLSDTVGYPTLLGLTMGLFVSPYGATSLREYFANGFEKYYLGNTKLVKEVSPVLDAILNNLHTESDN